MSDTNNDTPHAPGPSLWPIGFAIGVACILVGLVLSWIVAAIGVVLAVVFGILWAREVTRDVRDEVPAIEPETRTVADQATAAAAPAAAGRRSPPIRARGSSRPRRSASARPSAWWSRCPCSASRSCRRSPTSDETDVDLGPIENFPEGTFVIATYLSQAAQGEVSRRTSFVRNNGLSRIRRTGA